MKKAEKEKNGKTTIFQVIAGDHFIRYDLKTKQGKIDVEVSSFKWKEDTWQETYYHEFRANSWKYTETGISLWKNIIRLDMMDRLDIGPFG